MKLRPLDLSKLAALGIAGLAFANAVRASVIYSDDFEGIAVPASPGYLYGSAGGWIDSNLVNGNWWYDSAYAASHSRSAPFGEIALHTRGSYKYRAAGTTFHAGTTYRISARSSIDTNNTDGRLFLYIGLDGTGDINDANSLARADFTGAGAIPLGGASAATDSADWEGGNAGNWGHIALEYIATAEDDGKEIAIGVWGNGDSGIDDLVFEAVSGPGAQDSFTIIEASYDADSMEVTITFESKPDQEYAIDHSDDLKAWDEISDNFASQGEQTTITFPNPTVTKKAPSGAPRLFLRVGDITDTQ